MQRIDEMERWFLEKINSWQPLLKSTKIKERRFKLIKQEMIKEKAKMKEKGSNYFF